APSWLASKSDLHLTLKQDGSGSGRRTSGLLRGTLVAIQVAVCMVLMTSAALLMRGLYAAQAVEPGFSYENLAVVSFNLGGSGYDEERAGAFQRQLLGRVRELPRVDSVAQAAKTPLSPGR